LYILLDLEEWWFEFKIIYLTLAGFPLIDEVVRTKKKRHTDIILL
jgi:hypothetical protein